MQIIFISRSKITKKPIHVFWVFVVYLLAPLLLKVSISQTLRDEMWGHLIREEHKQTKCYEEGIEKEWKGGNTSSSLQTSRCCCSIRSQLPGHCHFGPFPVAVILDLSDVLLYIMQSKLARPQTKSYFVTRPASISVLRKSDRVTDSRVDPTLVLCKPLSIKITTILHEWYTQLVAITVNSDLQSEVVARMMKWKESLQLSHIEVFCNTSGSYRIQSMLLLQHANSVLLDRQ